MNYEPTPPHVSNSETSLEAAESIKPTVSKLRGEVLKCIKEMPSGLTCDQIEMILGLSHQTCSPRIGELRDQQPPLIQKVIDDEGRYAKRPTRTGRGAFVYCATEAA